MKLSKSQRCRKYRAGRTKFTLSMSSQSIIEDDNSRFLRSQWHDYISNTLDPLILANVLALSSEITTYALDSVTTVSMHRIRWYGHMVFVDYRRFDVCYALHSPTAF